MSHRARKRFGQNFLHDPAIIGRIVDAVRPQPGETLVEIGPGLGALTEGLLDRAGSLTAIEIDRDLAAKLRERFGDNEGFRLLEGDALEVDYAALAGGPIRLIGNLPYNLSSPLLFRFLEYSKHISDMTLMLQKELVDRIVAGPGSKTWGRLGVMVQARCDTERLLDIGPGAFRPAPKVDSAVLRLRPYAKAPVAIDDPARFAALVKQAFSQRRKTLRKALQGMLDGAAFTAADVDSGRRAETLSVEEFARLASQPGQP